MNINNSGIGGGRNTTHTDNVSQNKNNTVKKAGVDTPAQQPTPQGETVKISHAGKQLSRMDSSLRHDSEIDQKHQDKIAKLKLDIENGTYTPDSKAIAQGILKHESLF